jgi:hypothetical protein
MKPFEDPQIEGCLLCIGEGCAVSATIYPLDKIISLVEMMHSSEWSKIASEQNTPLQGNYMKVLHTSLE